MLVGQLRLASGTAPHALETIDAPLEFYRLRPWTPAQLPLTIDLGERDIGFRGEGFHGVEQMDGAPGRLTTGDATVHLPPVVHDRVEVDVDLRDATVHLPPVVGAGPLTLVLRMAVPRPSTIPSPVVVITLNDEPLGSTSPPTPGFSEVSFDLAPATVDRLCQGPSLLRIRTNPFVPREAGAGDDARELGVLIDSLSFVIPH